MRTTLEKLREAKSSSLRYRVKLARQEAERRRRAAALAQVRDEINVLLQKANALLGPADKPKRKSPNPRRPSVSSHDTTRSSFPPKSL